MFRLRFNGMDEDSDLWIKRNDVKLKEANTKSD